MAELTAGVTAVVPARGGSKGLPGKNLTTIDGRSLVRIAVDVAHAVEQIDAVVVSSDAAAILREGVACGAHAVRRPADLATDETPTIDVLRDLFTQAAADTGVVVLQPTSPLRAVSDVAACVVALSEPHVTSVVTVTPLEHPLEWTFRVDDVGRLRTDGHERTVARRQDARPVYRLNGAVYATTVGYLREHPLAGEGSRAVVMPPERSIDIDSSMDLVVARAMTAAVVM